MTKKGFTMIELLIIFCILGILAAIAIPIGMQEGARKKDSQSYQSIIYPSKDIKQNNCNCICRKEK